MHPVSRRQMNAMLDIFGQVPEPTRFDLACLNHQTDRMSLRRTWTAPQVRKAFGWLAARNATGSSCYIRLARAIAETRWIVIDELTGGMLSLQMLPFGVRQNYGNRWASRAHTYLLAKEDDRSHQTSYTIFGDRTLHPAGPGHRGDQMDRHR